MSAPASTPLTVELVLHQGGLALRCKHCGSEFIIYSEMIEHPTTKPVSFLNLILRQDCTIYCELAGRRFANPLKNFELKPWVEPQRRGSASVSAQLTESACDQFANDRRQEKVSPP